MPSYGRVLIFAAFYIVLSACLIHYNKFLMQRGHFPYPLALVLVHTAFCSCLSAFLYCTWPSLFPSLTRSSSRVSIDRDLILRSALPIAFCFTVQMTLSNTAYLHSSVAFLQMLKESNVVLVYTFSLALALEKFSWRNAGLLIFVVFATVLTIHGEMHFSRIGFAVQGTSQLFESTKIVLQAMLLSSAGRKLDALSYVLIVMPLSFFMLGSVASTAFITNPGLDVLPEWSVIRHWAPHLLANATVAFALNVAIALFVKHSSAVAFVLAGIAKDAMIVLAGGLVLEEMISGIQVVGFTLQLTAIGVLSLAKSFPEQFENGLFGGLVTVLFGADNSPGKPRREAFASLFRAPVQKPGKDQPDLETNYGAAKA